MIDVQKLLKDFLKNTAIKQPLLTMRIFAKDCANQDLPILLCGLVLH